MLKSGPNPNKISWPHSVVSMIKRCTVIFIILAFIPAIAHGMDIVSIKDKAGNQVGLYKESHALVIGVSEYTAGWPSLRGVEGYSKSQAGVGIGRVPCGCCGKSKSS